MAVILPVTAQQTQPGTTLEGSRLPSFETLRIRVLEGEGAVHNIQTGSVAPLVIEVRDSNENPVEGAEVTFELPTSGPGGDFPGQQLTQTTRTNYQGQAGWTGFRPNNRQGRFQVRVKAVLGNQTGHISVNQRNSLEEFATKEVEKKRPWYLSKRALIIYGLAGAGIATWLVLRDGNSSSSQVTVGVGPVVIGPPR